MRLEPGRPSRASKSLHSGDPPMQDMVVFVDTSVVTGGVTAIAQLEDAPPLLDRTVRPVHGRLRRQPTARLITPRHGRGVELATEKRA
jgi:hypothetical protein